MVTKSAKKEDLLEKLVDEADITPKKKAKTTKKVVTKKILKDEIETVTMEELFENSDIKMAIIGDVVEGTVLDVTSNTLLLDLGPRGTGIVLGKEMKDGLNMGKKQKVGDVVTATVTETENEDGYIELSIREASYEKAWENLETKKQENDVVDVKILDANKGGLMVEVNGMSGFLPVSQLSSENYPRVEDGDKNKILERLKRLIGKTLCVRIIDADREAEKLIVSEKAALSERERESIKELAVGLEIEGEISGVVDFGAFVKFSPNGSADVEEEDRLEGLVHISELAWQLIDDPRKIVKTGDHVKAKIIGIDDTRISLSMKALHADPWSRVTEKYNIGDIVTGKVDKINHFGSFVYLDSDIHGLAHVSEFQENFPKKKMDDVLVTGKTYKWKILSIEPKDHRMGLVLTEKDSVDEPGAEVEVDSKGEEKEIK